MEYLYWERKSSNDRGQIVKNGSISKSTLKWTSIVTMKTMSVREKEKKRIRNLWPLFGRRESVAFVGFLPFSCRMKKRFIFFLSKAFFPQCKTDSIQTKYCHCQPMKKKTRAKKKCNSLVFLFSP